jgi:hypothetical protein
VGNVLIAGWTNGQASASTYDIYTAKYAGADGALVWQTTYNTLTTSTTPAAT